MKDLYKTLGIDKSADESIIKKAYKKMAFKHHPDKGGTEDKFKEISEAYEILNDKQKRQTYDKFGYDALQGGGSSEVNPFDLFNNMFSGHGMQGMPGMQGMAGGIFDLSDLMGGSMGASIGNPLSGMMGNMNTQKHNRIEKIEVTLDDLYIGAKKTIIVENNIKCIECLGNGYLNNGKQLCDGCQGTKMVTQTIQLGPGMIQQSRRPCTTCNQKGFTIIPGYECNICNCNGTLKQKKKYNLNISKGNVDGKDIQLKGKGDYIKELDVQGDLTIKLCEVPHERFKRKNNDLFIEVNIPLQESLCGSTIKLRHLNNKYIYINIDKIIKPDYIMKVNGLGMPLLTDNGILCGDLLILFKIIYPDNLSNNTKLKLKEIFNLVNRYSNKDSHDIEYYKNVSDLNGESEAQQGVQCAHQ